MHCDSERLAFCGRRPITRLAGAGATWVVNFFLFIFLPCVFFQCWSVHCIDQGSVLHCIRIAYCMYSCHFFVSVFLLSVNLFSQCMGVHCLVNHTCTSLIMVLCCTFVYFRTVLNSFTCFCVFLFVFLLLCIPFFKFMFVHCFVGYVKTSFDKFSVLHSCATCTACVLFAFCTTILSPAN